MAEKEYWVGDIIGCTPDNQEDCLSYYTELGYGVKRISSHAVRITSTPLIRQEELGIDSE